MDLIQTHVLRFTNTILYETASMQTTTSIPSTFNQTCELPNNISYAQQCDMVLELPNICEGDGIVDYTALVLCQTTLAMRVFLVTSSIILLAIMFVAISTAADMFFSPNIAGIVNHLKISHNIAGVTFMAFGNGAPDIFSSFAAVTSATNPKPGMAFGSLLGAGMFVTTLVTAAIIFTAPPPFTVMRRPLIRDISFYILAVIWTFLTFVISHSTLELWETSVFLILYIIYTLTVIVGGIIYSRNKKQQQRTRAATIPLVTQNSQASIVTTTNNSVQDLQSTSSVSGDVTQLSPPYFTVDDDDTKKLPLNVRLTILFVDFLSAINPIDRDEWDESKWPNRAFSIIKAPITFILILTVPVVDRDWSKLLCIVQCFTCPIFALIASKAFTSNTIPSVPNSILALVIGIIPCVLIAWRTECKKEPRFYKAISSYSGFVMSVFWIYLLANEIVGIVTMIGVYFVLSHELLGLTVLAWSNSLGDLVADVAVSRQGSPRIAISAAYGGPLFNLLVGFGLPFTIVTIRNSTPVIIDFNTISKVLLIFLFISLTSSLIFLPLQRFHLRRLHAAYLILLYITFIVIVILAESKLLVL